MEAVASEMGCRHYALIHHDDLRVPRPDRVDLKDYPAAVTERLIGQHRYRRDPVIRGCIFADSAFLWSDLSRFIHLDRQDRASFELGAREGRGDFVARVTVDCAQERASLLRRRDRGEMLYLRGDERAAQVGRDIAIGPSSRDCVAKHPTEHAAHRRALS